MYYKYKKSFDEDSVIELVRGSDGVARKTLFFDSDLSGIAKA